MVRQAQRTRFRVARLTLLVPLLSVQSCAPGRISLPPGPGSPFPDYEAVFAQATGRCRGVRTLEAELALSGRAGQEKLRGRVLAGLAQPGSLRLVGVAPFGRPAFVLVAQPGTATLLLPRDGRVLFGAPASAILEALAGVALGPDDLRAVLTGCLVPNPEPLAGRAYANAWVAVDLLGGATAYLKSDRSGPRLVVGVRGPLVVEYSNFVGQTPRRVRLLLSGAGGADAPPETDLAVTLSQVQMNAALDPAAFSLRIPVDALPLTLDELRQAGPLGERPGASSGGDR